MPFCGPGVFMRAIPSLLLVLCLTACSEYDLNRPDDVDPKNPKDTGAPPDSEPPTDSEPPPTCAQPELPGEEIGVNDHCGVEPEAGFEPIIEWSAGSGKGCLSQPVVADVNGDGEAEIIVNFTSMLNGPGDLMVLAGDDGSILWQRTTANMAYGSPPAAGDIDGDGKAEIVVVREHESGMWADGDYTAALYDHDGTELWESEHFTELSFNWATAPIISDMDHDGYYEIVVGRVILDAATGSTRGEGAYGQGSYGIVTIPGMGTLVEASVPAVTDLDLDGVEEVIVGNAAYDADGNTLRHDASQGDAMIGIANLDDDPEGEIVGIQGNTIRAMDTDGSVLWGPITIQSANILATPAIGDLDQDGYPEIITAGGNQLVCLNHDGSTLWTAPVTDESGATGASIFDFEGDGEPEVVYIDEVEMVAYEGATGRVKFHSTDHASNTMFDYPTVADVDGDDQAEIVVCHNGFSHALSVYGDASESWVGARDIWNQHSYDIGNVDDDGTVPSTGRVYGFTTHNTWHSAIATSGEMLEDDFEAEISEVCLDDCDTGRVYAAVRLRNTGLTAAAMDVSLALYSKTGDELALLTTLTVPAGLASGHSSEAVWVEIPAEDLIGVDALWLEADDDGTGDGAVYECSESNNEFQFSGPFCD